MSTVDWESLLEETSDETPILPKAMTYRRSWDSYCRAVHVSCDDGHDYVVKGSQVGRSAFNDHVVGRIAMEFGAPVPSVGLVRIDPELIQINPDMSHIRPGVAHGSRFMPNCTDGWFLHVDVRENRSRFALLSVLYGWMVGAEKQFLYETEPPNLVYSFDHDAFFPSGPGWSTESLRNARFADVDEVIVDNCGLRHGELTNACCELTRLTPEMIATAIRTVPSGWGDVTDDERRALAIYLWERCESLRN